MKNFLISIFSILFIFACSSVETVDVQETKTVDLTSSSNSATSNNESSDNSQESKFSLSDIDIGEPHTRVFFDYDDDNLREDALSDLLAISKLMKENSRYTLLVEGHADERGTREYNLALSERRARAVEDFLVASGVSSFNIEVVGYGEEKPVLYDNASYLKPGSLVSLAYGYEMGFAPIQILNFYNTIANNVKKVDIIIPPSIVAPTANLDPSPAPGPILPITNGNIAIIVLIEVIIIGLNLKLHASSTAFLISLPLVVNWFA